MCISWTNKGFNRAESVYRYNCHVVVWCHGRYYRNEHQWEHKNSSLAGYYKGAIRSFLCCLLYTAWLRANSISHTARIPLSRTCRPIMRPNILPQSQKFMQTWAKDNTSVQRSFVMFIQDTSLPGKYLLNMLKRYLVPYIMLALKLSKSDRTNTRWRTCNRRAFSRRSKLIFFRGVKISFADLYLRPICSHKHNEDCS